MRMPGWRAGCGNWKTLSLRLMKSVLHHIRDAVQQDVELSLKGLDWVTDKNHDFVRDAITLIYCQKNDVAQKAAIIMSIKAVDKPLSMFIAMHYNRFCVDKAAEMKEMYRNMPEEMVSVLEEQIDDAIKSGVASAGEDYDFEIITDDDHNNSNNNEENHIQ